MHSNWETVLENSIRMILQQHPGGISEYDLLQRLSNSSHQQFSNTDFRDHHALFASHFLLFHILYRIRLRLLTENAGFLDINPVMIRIYPGTDIQSMQLTAHDPMQDYYLDLDNLRQTDEQDVDDMLRMFWERFLRPDERAKALQILGLKDPVDDITIKRHYRRLAMQHHPDRGGDKAELQAINAAAACLLPGKR